MTFLAKEYKKSALGYFGKACSRDEEKIGKKGLTIAKNEDGIPYFEEAESVLFVKKLYMQPMAAEYFLEKEIIDQWFPGEDFHELYIAEITKVLTKC